MHNMLNDTYEHIGNMILNVHCKLEKTIELNILVITRTINYHTI